MHLLIALKEANVKGSRASYLVPFAKTFQGPTNPPLIPNEISNSVKEPTQ